MATRFTYTILDRKTGISTGRFRNMKLARQAVSKMPKGCYSIIFAPKEV